MTAMLVSCTNVKIVKQFINLENIWFDTQNQNMKVSDIPATSVSIRQHNIIILRNTWNINMKVSDILVTNVSIRQHQDSILRDTRKINMGMSGILVTSVNIKQDN